MDDNNLVDQDGNVVGYDGDVSTNKYVLIAWSDLDGNWPNEPLPKALFEPKFTLVSSATAGTSTKINFSAASTAPSHQFSSQSVTVEAVSVNLDVNGDGVLTDDGDGQLIMKYLFGFRDPSIVPPDIKTLLDAELQRAKNHEESFLNPDGSNRLIGDALNDGILVRRYLRYCQYPAESHWKGPDLLLDADDPPPDRSWEDSWSILDSFNPLMPVPTGGDTLIVASLDANAPSAPSGYALLAAPAEPKTAFRESATSEEATSTSRGDLTSPSTDGMALTASTNGQVAAPPTALASSANQQKVTPYPENQTVFQGSPVNIEVNYTTVPVNSPLTGLGLRMHYDSDQLTFEQLTDLLGTTLLQQQPPVDDTADYDGDPATDKYVLVSWADIDSAWPGQIPVSLLTANLKASSTASGSTSVNFTSSSTAAGWTFVGTSAGITFLPAQGGLSGYVYIDANHNGQFDANEGLPGVTIILAGPVQTTTVTDDDGRYAFINLPAGLYSITEKQPAACIDGLSQVGTIDGTTAGAAETSNQITAIDLPGTISGVDYRFTEVSLRPEFIPNRALATSVQPVGSANWKKMIRETMARAEYQSGNAAAATAVGTNSPATITQAPAVRQSVSAALASGSAQNPIRSVASTVASEVPTSQANAVPTASAVRQSSPPLMIDQLTPIINEAVAAWANVGLPATTLDKLSTVKFSVADLPGSQLGWTENNKVILDRDAAGYGWFIDPTPSQDEEFHPVTDSRQLQAIDRGAIARMDLLTVVEHELGHVVGLLDLDAPLDDLMSSSLSKGIRREVSAANADAVFAEYDGSDPS